MTAATATRRRRDDRAPAPASSVREAIGATAATPSWSLAKFVATAGQGTQDERRAIRWGLRGLLRQKGVSALPRVAQCGVPIGNNPVKLKRRDDGGGHVSGVETCGSVWSCPVCAAVIRNYRAEEITRGMAEHLRRPTKAERAAGWKATGLPPEQRNDPEAVARYVANLPTRKPTKREKAAGIVPTEVVGVKANAGGLLFVTLTLPHGLRDRLAPVVNEAGTVTKPGTIDLVSEGFRALQQTGTYRAERETYGILGHVRAFELTHGENGWHPHLHLLVVLAAPITARAAAKLEAAWLERWNRWLIRQGWTPASAAHGVRVDLVRRDSKAVALYVAKLQEGDKKAARVNVAAEVTRADLKRAAPGSRVPFQILADFGTDGVARRRGRDGEELPGDLDLWHEYQLATKGRSAIRWSVGLRALLLPDEPELTDGEVTEQEQGGELVAVLMPQLYRKILRRPYADAYLQVAAERGGLDGVKRFVRWLGLDPNQVHPPEALTHWEEITELWEHIKEKEASR